MSTTPRISVEPTGTSVVQGPSPVPAATAGDVLRQPPDSEYLTTGLPSGCICYPGFTENVVHVRRFNVQDVLKIYDARAEASLRQLAEVVAGTLHGLSLASLTVGDFWFLMYWHRLHSYPKSPFRVNWTCVGDKHMKEVRDGTKPLASLEQEVIIKKSDLRVKDLAAADFMKLVDEIRAEYGVEATAMRMADYLRIIDMEEENDAARESEQPLPHAPSAFLRARHASRLYREGSPLVDRMTELLNLDFSAWPQLDRLQEVGDHGVQEVFHVACSDCGTKTEVEVALDALTFLPEL